MKKLLSIVLVLTLILSSFAFAAPTDTAGTTYESAVNKLMGLGVLTGYPDNTFKPTATITRAEFAAVAVRLLGLETAATYAKGATKFSDVPATHWASGYVNIAADQGLINGYPNGTFGPTNMVTYNEAITILVRVLGYAPEVDEKGTWPSNYIAKAAILGVTDGVTFAGSLPATRGDIAKVSDNSLDIPNMIRTGFGTEAKYEVPTGANEITLLTSKIKATSFEGYIVTTKATEADYKYDVKLNQLKSTGNLTTELDLADGAKFDFTAHLGEKVKVWKNTDGDIFFVETKGTVVTTKLASTTFSASAVSIDVLKATDVTDTSTYYFDDLSTHVATASSAQLYMNQVNNTDFTASIIKPFVNPEVTTVTGNGSIEATDNMMVKLVLDGKVIKAAVFTKLTKATVDGVVGDTIQIPGKDLALAGMSSNVAASTVAKDDVIYYYAYNTNVANADDDDIVRYEIVKAAPAVEGKLEKVTSTKIQVAGKEYLYIDGTGVVSITTSDYDSRTKLAAVVGDTLKITFDNFGNVATVKNQTGTASSDYAVVTDMGATTNAYNKTTVLVKLLNAKNEIVEYTLASDAQLQVDGVNQYKLDAVTIFTNAATKLEVATAASGTVLTVNENNKAAAANAAAAGTVVTYKLNSDGKVSTLNIINTLSDKTAGFVFDKDLAKVGTFKITSSTLIYDRATEKLVTLAELKDNATYNFFAKADPDSSFNEAEFVLVTGGVVTSASKYAMYQKYETVVDGNTVYLWVDGARTAYFADSDDVSTLPTAKDIVEVEFSGANVTDMTTLTLSTGYTLVDVDPASRVISFTSGGATIILDLAKTVNVYEYSTADGYNAVALADLDADNTSYVFDFYYKDSEVQVIKITRP